MKRISTDVILGNSDGLDLLKKWKNTENSVLYFLVLMLTQMHHNLCTRPDVLGQSLLNSTFQSENDILGTSLQDLGEDSVINCDALPIATSTPTKYGDLDKVHAKPRRQKEMSSYVLMEVGVPSGEIERKALDSGNIQSSLKETCACFNKCVTKFDFRSVKKLRLSYWHNTTKCLRRVILKRYISKSYMEGRHRMITLENDISVCSKAFLNLFRINKNTFSHVAKGSLPSLGMREKSKDTLKAINWFEEFASFMGDRMPHCEDILLPVKMLKCGIYTKYKIEVLGTHVSKSQFYKLWKMYFPHVKIKQTSSFSKCSTCSTLEKQWENSESIYVKAKYRKLKEEHYERQQMERKYYYSKRDMSRMQPNKFMSVIIDGMDQSKTNLPHFAGRRSKNINPADLLKTHITGVINHGHGGFFTYLDYNQYPHDPNLTINVLLKTIEKTAVDMGNKLPQCIYIQADNCWRENKNRYVLAFLEYLVAENIFNEVHISFLMVGHTHEDVDAAFSKISAQLRKTDVETIQELLSLLPNSMCMKTMHNVKKWLEPYIVKITHLTQPLHFKFSKCGEEVRVSFKGKHDDSWLVLNGQFLKGKPTGIPDIVSPDHSKIDTSRLLKQVTNARMFFKNPQSIKEWEVFCGEMNNADPLDEEWSFSALPRQEMNSVESLIMDLPESVQNLLEKETRKPEVIIPKRNRRQ